MLTNLPLDNRLVERAREAGKHRTKKEAVTAALKEYVSRRKQMGIFNLVGTVDYDPAWDHKAARHRKIRPPVRLHRTPSG